MANRAFYVGKGGPSVALMVALGITLTIGAANAQQKPPPVQSSPPSAASSTIPTLQLGRPVNGNLSNSDMLLDDNSFADPYEFNGQAGQRVIITMNSTVVDPFLMVLGPNNFRQTHDDIAAGNLNSRLELTLPEAGVYNIIANTAVANQTGAYSIAVTAPQAAGAQQRNTPAARPSPPTPPATRSAQASPPPAQSRQTNGGMISVGQTVDGALTTSDRRLDNGNYVDIWNFTGQAGQRLAITMTSTQLAAQIIMLGDNSFAEGSGAIPFGTRNATLNVTLPSTGAYRIAATTQASDETGSYQLSVAAQPPSVQPGRPAQVSPPTAQTRQANGGQIRVGETVNGTLTASDPTLSDGSHIHRYQLTGQAGQRITITMDSTAYDTVLLVNGPNNYQQVNDDAGPGTFNSRLDLTLPAAGTYMITTNTVGASQTGAYRLSVSPGGTGQSTAASPPPPAPVPPVRQQPARRQPATGSAFNAGRDCPPMPSGAAANTQGRRVGNGGPISFDEPVCGRLQQGDQVLGDGTFADIYTINLTADGSTYQAILGAEGFDPFIIVMAPDSDPASVETMPIASGRNLNTVITPKVSGTYTIAVNSAQTGSGRYRFRVVRTPD